MSFIKKYFTKVIIKQILLITSFICLCGISYRLLFLKQIGGPEFVVLVVTSVFACLVMNFLSEIQELSIGGNLLKLKEARSEVEETIEQLKQFRLETFRLFLSKAAEFPGGWGTLGFYDERAVKFVNLIEQIRNSEVFDDLKHEINLKANLIIENHLKKMLSIDPTGGLKGLFNDREGGFPSKEQILLAVKSEYFDDSVRHFQWTKDKVKSEFLGSIDTYAQLLKIEKESSLV